MQSKIKEAVLEKVGMNPEGIDPVAISGMLPFSLQDIFVAVFELERKKEIVLHGGLFFIAPRRCDVTFKDVKPGEELVYATSLCAVRGVKLTHEVIISGPEGVSPRPVSLKANVVILSVTGHIPPEKFRSCNLDYLEDVATVIVYR
jgi:hypothetical protein